MRLSTDQLTSGWLHPRRVVRNVVASHFADALTSDPDVTAHAIRGAREFGWEKFLTWGHRFCELPLADDAALDWVCGEVERADDGAPTDNQKRHLTAMLARAGIALVERHRERLLALPSLQPQDRQKIVARLELVDCPPAECWRRLEDHCRMAAAGETFADARIHEAHLLLEPLERAGGDTAARVMDMLRKPPPDRDGDGDDPADWLTGLMIGLAGRLRLEEAAAPIVDLLDVDWDWYDEEVVTALTRIGTAGVVRLVQERYPRMAWSARLYATSILARIRCEETAAAITAALDGEDDDGLRAYLGTAAAAQFDDRIVPLARAVLDEDPDDPERGEIREQLVAFSHLSGHDLPERDAWEREVDEFDDRMSRLGDPRTSPLAGLWDGPFDDEEDDASDADLDFGDADDDEPAAEERLFRGSRIGRNEPCPCGSGKKYKRCCLLEDPPAQPPTAGSP